jgi:hypothetical protein
MPFLPSRREFLTCSGGLLGAIVYCGTIAADCPGMGLVIGQAEGAKVGKAIHSSGRECY